jgi:hypothetical protein
VDINANWTGVEKLPRYLWTGSTGKGGVAPRIYSDGHTDSTTVVWLSGGSLGGVCRLRNRVVTRAGRVDLHTLRVRMAEH